MQKLKAGMSCTDLASLEDCLGFQVLVMSRVLDISLDPTDVFTTAEAPFPETLFKRNTCEHQAVTNGSVVKVNVSHHSQPHLVPLRCIISHCDVKN